MSTWNRRQVLASAAAIPAASLAAAVAFPSTVSGYLFFRAPEASFIEAACDRLIPPDSRGFGARAARVPERLDRHLAGDWGRGARPYRLGVWQPGTPAGCRHGRSPADLFRCTLTAIHRDLASRGTQFSALPVTGQDAYLASLEAGLPLPGAVATAAFFDLLLLMSTEAFFAHPGEGAQRDRVPWPLRGFAGAFASTAWLAGGTRRQETLGDIP